jgi:hypothetical protein
MAVVVTVLETIWRYRMINTTFGEDPEDWTPEDDSVATDPLTLDEMNDKQIQFYADRVQRQIEMMLSAEG